MMTFLLGDLVPIGKRSKEIVAMHAGNAPGLAFDQKLLCLPFQHLGLAKNGNHSSKLSCIGNEVRTLMKEGLALIMILMVDFWSGNIS